MFSLRYVYVCLSSVAVPAVQFSKVGCLRLLSLLHIPNAGILIRAFSLNVNPNRFQIQDVHDANQRMHEPACRYPLVPDYY